MRTLSFSLAVIILIIVPRAHSFSLDGLNDLKVDYFRVNLSHAYEIDNEELDLGLTRYDYEVTSGYMGLGWYASTKWPIELGIMGRKFEFETDGVDRDNYDDTGYCLGLMVSISREFRIFQGENTKVVIRLFGGIEKKWPDEEIPGLHENQTLFDFGLYLELVYPVSENVDFIIGIGVSHQSTGGDDKGLNATPASVGVKYRFW